MMAYERYDSRDAPPDQRARSRDEGGFDDERARRERSSRPASRSGRDDRGFFERAGDEIASWFGDDDAERRRRQDQMSDRGAERRGGDRGSGYDDAYGNDRDRDRAAQYDRSDDRSAFSSRGTPERANTNYDHGRDRNRDRERQSGRDDNWNDNRGLFARGGSSERDYDRGWRQEYAGRDYNRERADRELDRGWTDRYEPMTGDYGRSGRRSERADDDYGRSQSKWAEDEYRGTSRAGSANWSDRSRDERADRSRDDRFDPHYRSWRDRHLSELDRDYDDYRAENQSRFESDFGSWRERRQQKRGVLAQVREHMEVVGSDNKHIGKVDKTAGDRLILTKSDPESGGLHHSISCSDIDRVDGDRVILDCTAD